ncbi:E3 ubiquitin-protein ligase RNF168-like [Macrotis lagotis]|uniref:E3 ubiquitin-protein ligase RNF168-like n=1 Tax=Macrotis lagotis TaxID=92651 RepID=UPI003D68A7C1
MAAPPEAPLRLSDCLCAICTEILQEPVSLPCGHTLCLSCFQQTIQKTSLCCPFCRRRVSSWARARARQNTLVDRELRRRLRKQRLRAGGRRRGAEPEAERPPRRLSAPGELRREYEEELSKVEAEKRACAEEEARLSAGYISQLLAQEEEEEEEATQREAGPRQLLEEGQRQRAKKEDTQTRDKEMRRPRYQERARPSREDDGERPRPEKKEWPNGREARMKMDNELAREISKSLKNLKSVLTSLFTANSSYPASDGASKKTKTNPGDFHDSPTFRLPSTPPALQNEVGTAGDKGSYPSEVGIAKGKNPRCLGQRGRGLPTSSTQACYEIENIGARASLEQSMESSLGGESRPGTSFEDEIINRFNATNYKLPKTKFFCSGKAVANLSGKSENECTAEMKNEGTNLLVNREIPQIKSLDSKSKTLSDSGFSSKKKNLCPEKTSEKEGGQSTVTQKLIDLEHFYFERRKEEEKDRLLALQLQGEMNKEENKLEPGKRTRDENFRCPTVSLNPNKRRKICSKSSMKKN